MPLPSLQSMAETEAANTPDITTARLVIVSDGRAGHENQSIGVAEMLGFADPEVVTLRRAYSSRWLEWLPVATLFGNYAQLEEEVSHLANGHRVVVIGTGHHVSRVLRALKRKIPRLFTVVIMKPAGKTKDFDVIAVPQHDSLSPRDNMVVTLGPPNRVTRDRVAQEASRWQKRLSNVPSPRLAVLVGGPSRHGGNSPAELTSMMQSLLELARKKNIGLLVTASRRTGNTATDALRALLEKAPVKNHFWAPGDPTQRDNPYLAYLGLADAVVATADSVSMVCEAASAGKPVYLWGDPTKQPKKFRKLYDTLQRQQRIKWWDGTLNLRPAAAGLMDTMMVAGFIRARWTKRFGQR